MPKKTRLAPSAKGFTARGEASNRVVPRSSEYGASQYLFFPVALFVGGEIRLRGAAFLPLLTSVQSLFPSFSTSLYIFPSFSLPLSAIRPVGYFRRSYYCR